MKKSNKQKKSSRRVNVTDSSWFKSERTRPKTITVEFTRTPEGGYHATSASILKVVNQYSAEWVAVSPGEVVGDIMRLGLKA